MDSYLGDPVPAQQPRLAQFECYFGAFILFDALFGLTSPKGLK